MEDNDLTHISEIIPFFILLLIFANDLATKNSSLVLYGIFRGGNPFIRLTPPPPHPDTSVNLVIGGSGFVPTVETGLFNICSRKQSSVTTHRKTKKGGTRCWRKRGERMGEEPNHAWCHSLVLNKSFNTFWHCCQRCSDTEAQLRVKISSGIKQRQSRKI
jgi:hypothetical protein